MTCKECIYSIACDQHLDAIQTENYFTEPPTCAIFKDRSRFVELPLKVGDTFYTFNYDEDAVSEQIVDEIRIIDDIEGDNIVFYGQCVIFTLNEIGSFAFLTKAEAEQALKERKANEVKIWTK